MKMNHIICRILMWGLYILGMLICAIPSVLFPGLCLYFVIAGGAVMVSGLVLAILFLRCQYCGGALNIRGLPPEYCPHCGKRIIE